MRNHSDDRLNIDSFYIMFSSYFLLLKTLGFSPGVFNFIYRLFRRQNEEICSQIFGKMSGNSVLPVLKYN